MLQRWNTVTDPAFPWEQAALNYLRERLPEQEPFRAWSNFEFVAEDGSINEVDLLVVSLYKLYLVEIKSRPGRVSGDTGTWTWTHEGRVYTADNPLLLANRKAKKLKSLLQHQPALRNTRVPYVKPMVFLSAPGLLARYDQLALLEKLRDACTQRHDVPGFIVLIAADEQRPLPVLDGKPVLVILASERARIPDPGWPMRIAGRRRGYNRCGRLLNCSTNKREGTYDNARFARSA